MTNYEKALENFLNDGEFTEALSLATRAGFSGSGYSVELYEDGSFTVLWDNTIGNKYQPKGIILSVPQFSDEDWKEFEDSEQTPVDFDGTLAQQMRDSLADYEAMLEAR